jgi:ABC-type multidrug transport system ATPase subunit
LRRHAPSIRELTSGLDAFTALNIVDTLASLAHKQRRTVVCTIHQPRTEIFDLLDRILLLVAGRVVFAGSPKASIAFLEANGYALPKAVNPADFLIDLVRTDSKADYSQGAGTGSAAASPGQSRRNSGSGAVNERYESTQNVSYSRLLLMQPPS